ncbi:MAG: hypothetical protein HETSPECPRED_004887 [Heterodermia speciosa]|uniref:Uncharacterized protein n=1 Tax=Heterodermia speciosa TaxID=116794 RepID=A0A8H3EEN2_9LECA|nr:MAG: hypothetical protein HETSPECPRED_004887 [Heterodermia speciosa]
MARSAENSSHQGLKPEERRRPTLQRAPRDDQTRAVARIDPSPPKKDAKPQTEQSSSRPESSKKGQSRQTSESRHPRYRGGSGPNAQEERSPSPERIGTFTHLRRNAVSDGIPYGDYRYLTGGRSEYECLQDAYRRRGDRSRYAGQEERARSRDVSNIEGVGRGDGAVDEVGEKKRGEVELGSGSEKGKEVGLSDLEERGAKRDG